MRFLKRRVVLPLHILIELLTAVALGAFLGTVTVYWLIGK